MLEQIATHGVPSLNVVIAHLKYLSFQGWNSTTDLKEFMKDVRTVYSFIDSDSTLMGNQQLLEDGKIWCNLALKRISTISKEQFRHSWMDAKELRMALVDKEERMRFSESILNEYPRTLGVIGLEVSELQPSSTFMEKRERMESGSKPEFESMWKMGYFCDVELNIRGENFKAHRIVLAAASGYWRSVFTGAPVGGLNVDRSCSKETVLGVLRYFYTNRLPEGLGAGARDGTATGTFMEWLKLAREWEVTELRMVLENMLSRARIDAGPAVGNEKIRFNTIT